MLKNQKNRKKLKLFTKKYYNKLKTQNCEYHKIPQCGAGEKLFEQMYYEKPFLGNMTPYLI